MAENTKELVVDASFVLSYLLPDEKSGRADKVFARYAAGEISLISCPLLPFEVLNGLRSAIIKKRLDSETAEKLAEAFLLLDISVKPVDYFACWCLSLDKHLSLYDASYLLLARQNKVKLLTTDSNLESV
ncbi:type II toxin-antitoxin system VapC family toxin [Candidatus Gottesmanbacteria bacterium]|nr:type II toxin-antitoxin system VapC family toxin [Candidatus Gottesmanbacteria bacterium]